MADRIKTVSQYDGSNWVNETPIGADASNIDVVTAGSTSRNLQDVLGTPPASGNITNNINSKVSISGGDVADTIVSKDITNYDSSTEVDNDILTDTAAVTSTNTSTLWSRFNLFRKKVSNNFENYFTNSSLVGADPGVTITGDDSTAYTTAAINNYLSNVIGYTSASAPSAGTVASQLSTLNSNVTTLNSYIVWKTCTIGLANTNIMTVVGGSAWACKLNSTYYMISFSIAIKYTANRGADYPSWRIQNPDGEGWLHPNQPYFYPCRIDGSTNMLWSYTNISAPYFNNPVALTSNQTMRWSGVGISKVYI